MCHHEKGRRLFERSRLYIASLLVSIAKTMLLLAHRLFRVGILDVGGIKNVVLVSEKLRRLGWWLVRWKPK